MTTFYRVKTRRALAKEFKNDRYNLGWWYDCCPGQYFKNLRRANKADLDRCILHEDSSRNPDDYMCEGFDGGYLINKRALQ